MRALNAIVTQNMTNRRLSVFGNDIWSVQAKFIHYWLFVKTKVVVTPPLSRNERVGVPWTLKNLTQIDNIFIAKFLIDCLL